MEGYIRSSLGRERGYRRLSLTEVPARQRELAEREVVKAAYKAWISPPYIHWWENPYGDCAGWVDDERPWNEINLCSNMLEDNEDVIAIVWEEVRHCQQFSWDMGYRFEPEKRERDADEFVFRHTGLVNEKKLKPWEYKE